MPSRKTTNFPRLKHDDEFEDLLRDLCAEEWDDPGTEKYGRRGQKQLGVDVYGQPADASGRYRGVQCKLRTTNKQLTEKELNAEVKASQQFPLTIDRLIIATDTPPDTNTQLLVDQIREREVAAGRPPVYIWFWPAIEKRLAEYPQVLVTYYADWVASLTTTPLVTPLIDVPVTASLLVAAEDDTTATYRHQLGLRGLRLTNTAMLSGNIAPDAFIMLLDIRAALSAPQNAALVRRAEFFPSTVADDIPIYLLGSEQQVNEASSGLAQFHRVIFLQSEDSESFNIIFRATFAHGRARRGNLPMLNLSARSNVPQGRGSMLDLDLTPWLATDNYPDSASWDRIVFPALKTVTNELTVLGSTVRVQVDPLLFVPAAVALGFLLNIRLITLAVWTRRAGASDLHQRLWFSDGERGNYPAYTTTSHDESGVIGTAVVELTTHVPIDVAVTACLVEQGLRPAYRLRIAPDDGAPAETTVLDEGKALAFADHVAHEVRRLTSCGVTDIHLFARIPAALAVLIGQRLLACGRLHLYWYTNPGYQYAFTLK